MLESRSTQLYAIISGHIESSCMKRTEGAKSMSGDASKHKISGGEMISIPLLAPPQIWLLLACKSQSSSLS